MSSFKYLRMAIILRVFLLLLATLSLVGSFSVVDGLCFMTIVFLSNLKSPLLSRGSAFLLEPAFSCCAEGMGFGTGNHTEAASSSSIGEASSSSQSQELCSSLLLDRKSLCSSPFEASIVGKQVGLMIKKNVFNKK